MVDVIGYRFSPSGRLVLRLADGTLRLATRREAVRLLRSDSGIALAVALARLGGDEKPVRLARSA